MVLATYESSEEGGRESAFEPFHPNNVFLYHDYDFWNAQFYMVSPVVEPNIFIKVYGTICLKERDIDQRRALVG